MCNYDEDISRGILLLLIIQTILAPKRLNYDEWPNITVTNHLFPNLFTT